MPDDDHVAHAVRRADAMNQTMWLVWHEFHQNMANNDPAYANVDAASAVEFVHDVLTTAFESAVVPSKAAFRAQRDAFLKDCDEAAT